MQTIKLYYCFELNIFKMIFDKADTNVTQLASFTWQMSDLLVRVSYDYGDALKGVQIVVGLPYNNVPIITITPFARTTHNIINMLNEVLSAQLDQISSHLYC